MELEDILDSMYLAMISEGIPPETASNVIATVEDALVNNL